MNEIKYFLLLFLFPLTTLTLTTNTHIDKQDIDIDCFLRSIVCTNELETVAKVEAPDTYTLVIRPGRYDNRIRRHVQARDW